MIAIRLQFTKQSVVSSSMQHSHSLRVKNTTTLQGICKDNATGGSSGEKGHGRKVTRDTPGPDSPPVTTMQYVYITAKHQILTRLRRYRIGTARKMPVDIDATPDLLLIIQQKLRKVQYQNGSLFQIENYLQASNLQCLPAETISPASFFGHGLTCCSSVTTVNKKGKPLVGH